MRTADGKLVILDFGLMTEVNENQRIGLVEFMAHLTMEDWDSLFKDLVTLGEPPAPSEHRTLVHYTIRALDCGGRGERGLGQPG